MRLIDAEALDDMYETGTDPKDTCADMTYIRAANIDNAPTIEAELVRHGRWVGNKKHKSCSVCGVTFCIPDGEDGEMDMSFYKYCPKCGARMD